MMLLIFALACFATAAYYVGELVTSPARERQNLLTRATQYGRMRVMHGRELPRFRDRAIAPIVAKLARLMLRVNPRTTVDGVAAKLMAAGMRTTSPSAFLAASVEAGLGFDGAIAKLTEHMDGPLIEEFELTLGEIRVGEGRSNALKKMAERVPAQEMASFVRAIVQADQLGISLGRLLRVQATDARLKRQAAAEEKAMKAPIKMLFPMVIFIFPAMFIVIL